LHARFDLEVIEDEEKYEEVVDAEGFFDQVACEELEGRTWAHGEVDAHIEDHRLGDPGGAPDQRLPHREGVTLALEDAQIEREHRQDIGVEAHPWKQAVAHEPRFRMQRIGNIFMVLRMLVGIYLSRPSR